MTIYPQIESLLYYAQTNLLLDELDVIFARNQLLDELKLTDYVEYEVNYEEIEGYTCPDLILEQLIKYAIDAKIIDESQAEYFGNKLMTIVSKRPSEIVDLFNEIKEKSPVKASEWFYDYCIKNNYVKQTAIARNKHWEAKGTRGKLEITINLSKPEKSNKDVAAALAKKESSYPSCMICRDNEGYAGNGVYRQNLRTIPCELGGEDFFWQYSPYAYYKEHCIVINAAHTPMVLNDSTVTKLLDFNDYMPHYFIGCNAALPRIGGSILTHDHFQGGFKQLPMFKVGNRQVLKSKEFALIDISIADWYNNVIRLVSRDRDKLTTLTNKIVASWENYSDESVGLIAVTTEKHNSCSVVVRKLADGRYNVDIILRNNRVSDEFPTGIFHAHPEYHNIKSEAIGLIEAMGLFILPGRLDEQMKIVEKYLTREEKFSTTTLRPDMVIHKTMIEKLMKEGGAKVSALEAQLNIKDEINSVCEKILENTAVFKNDVKGNEAFAAFLALLEIEPKK